MGGEAGVSLRMQMTNDYEWQRVRPLSELEMAKIPNKISFAIAFPLVGFLVTVRYYDFAPLL